MSSEQVTEYQDLLRRIGFPLTVDGVAGAQTIGAVRVFQLGYVGDWRHPTVLTVDGIVGPKTSAALRFSAGLGGRVSEHFTWREFACHCPRREIVVRRELVVGLERYREQVGRPVRIVSGYRDPEHNRLEGGASNSQHLYGSAADLDPVLSVGDVEALGVFSGIGFQGDSGLVRHVDVRHAAVNTTGASVSSPATWAY